MNRRTLCSTVSLYTQLHSSTIGLHQLSWTGVHPAAIGSKTLATKESTFIPQMHWMQHECIHWTQLHTTEYSYIPQLHQRQYGDPMTLDLQKKSNINIFLACFDNDCLMSSSPALADSISCTTSGNTFSQKLGLTRQTGFTSERTSSDTPPLVMRAHNNSFSHEA